MDPTQTFRWSDGLVTWHFEPSGPVDWTDPAQRRVRAADCCERLLGLLGDFGRASAAEVTTVAHGDGAFAAVFQSPAESARFLSFVRNEDAVRDATLELTLTCLERGPSGEPRPLDLPGGASVTLFVSLDDDGKLDGGASRAAWISLRLNVDIYAPLSWGRIRDNAELARLNGPRLGAFLARIAAELPARPLAIDALDYEGLVDFVGFNVPT